MKPYQRLRFNSAIDWFRRKLPIPTERSNQIVDDAQNWAFTIAGIEAASLLAAVQQHINRVLEGNAGVDTFGEFRRSLSQTFDAAGYSKAKPWRIALVFKNNIRSAYAAGRYQQQQESAEYLQYWHDHPITPRPAHKALHQMVFKADDPIIQQLYPPNGHGCSCTMHGLSQLDVDREGLQVTTINRRVRLRDRVTQQEYSVPAIEVDGELRPIVEPGWNYAPGASTSDEQLSILRAATGKLPERLREMALRRLQQ